ncbi:hypothetical protein YB2330_005252 [Saitoella coloradoensis]
MSDMAQREHEFMRDIIDVTRRYGDSMNWASTRDREAMDGMEGMEGQGQGDDDEQLENADRPNDEHHQGPGGYTPPATDM